ncbi:uncharacterized protein LOC117329817 isoform X2 [Pecten maximus]|uniref:uncharacterized protein LOC117329817 isoform X2 n=1 Tax=Pecten maximus TaxID=6579 RepID=UPI001457EAE0|nr:uncharacterized protein LOC117329817 isoform X2 [Pecten maximus]
MENRDFGVKFQCLPFLVAILFGFTSCFERRLVATDDEKIIKIPGLIGMNLASPVLENWNITAEDSNNIVELQIDMNIQICETCSCDRLFIYEGGTLLERFCGETNRQVLSSGRSLFVVLLSVNENTHYGSKLTYKQVSKIPNVPVVHEVPVLIPGISSAAFLIICLSIIYCICKRERNKTSRHTNYQHNNQPDVWTTPVSQDTEQFDLPPSYEEVCQNPEAFGMQDLHS